MRHIDTTIVIDAYIVRIDEIGGGLFHFLQLAVAVCRRRTTQVRHYLIVFIEYGHKTGALPLAVVRLQHRRIQVIAADDRTACDLIVTGLSTGLRRGDVGAVVQVYSPTSIEVEFVTATGHTQAVVTLDTDQVRPVGSRDLLAVRHLDAA